jgi:alkanesulfonate monooxygenase SsuD/methylene tetrahydromethanopterin reductase-like flavin-dependent oxidoreductase (luciferase family)
LHTDTGELVTNTAMVDFRSMSSRYIIGDPAVARDRVRELKQDLDPSEIVLRMQMPGVPTNFFEHSLRLFAEKVMPDFV